MKTLCWVCQPCPKQEVGITVFHGHIAALTCARYDNKKAGRKVKKVVVRDQHFEIVEVQTHA